MPYTEWDQIHNSFSLSFACPNPACGKEILEPQNAHILSRCPHCSTLLEWLPHQKQNEQKPTFWPRVANAHYSHLTGQEFMHQSSFDWGVPGGNCSRNAYVSDPHQAVFGKPDPARTFTLEKRWHVDNVGSRRKLIHSMVVHHENLFVLNTDGKISIYNSIMRDLPPEPPQELPWPGANLEDGRDFLSELCVSTPYVCLHSGEDIVVWKTLTRTRTTKEFFSINRNDPNRTLRGTPIFTTSEGRYAFVIWEIDQGVSSKESTLHVIRQNTFDGPFEHHEIMVPRLMTPPVLSKSINNNVHSLKSTASVLGFSKSGRSIVRLSNEQIFGDLKYDILHVKNALTSSPKTTNIHPVMVAANDAKEEQLWIAHRRPTADSKPGDLYVSNIDLNAEDRAWKTIEIGQKCVEVFGLSVANPTSHYQGDKSISTQLVITTEQGIFLNYRAGEPSVTEEEINADRNDEFLGSMDQVILTNIGCIFRVGRELRLNWESSRWGPSIGNHRKTMFNDFKGQKYRKGIAITKNRIFVADFHYESAAIYAIDIQKI